MSPFEPMFTAYEGNFRHWVRANPYVINRFGLYLVGERLIEFEFDVGVWYSLKVKVTLFFIV